MSCTHISPALQNTSEIGTSRFHRDLEIAKLRHQGYTQRWLFDKISRLLLHLDQSLMKV